MARPGPGAGSRGDGTWSAVAASDDPVTGYRVLVRGARSRFAPASATRVVLPRMSPGRRAIRVQATNGVGVSPTSPRILVEGPSADAVCPAAG